MLLQLVVAASIASGSVARTTGISPHQCLHRAAGPQIFRPRRTCAHLSQLEPNPGFNPWTHEPHCRSGRDPDDRGKERKPQEFCIYTRTNHETGRGFSILASSAVVNDMAMISTFSSFDDTGGEADRPPYEKRQLPGRGIGLVANRGIKLGEVIMIDTPSLIASKQAVRILGPRDRHRLVWRGLLQLSAEEQNRTRALAVNAASSGDLLEDIMHTNSIGIMLSGKEDSSAVMPEISRINHSCRPNAFYRFDESTMSVDVFAVRDVMPGEELTISYTDAELPSMIRKWVLKHRWNFDCTCDICSSSAEKLAQSDDRLTQIEANKKKLQEEQEGNGNPQAVLNIAAELLQLYDREGLFVPKAGIYETAAYAASKLGELKTAVAHANDAFAHWKIIMGEGTVELQRLAEFLENPTKHHTWKKWKHIG